MDFEFTKFEKFALFCGFMLIAGGMVGAAYWMVTGSTAATPEIAIAPTSLPSKPMVEAPKPQPLTPQPQAMQPAEVVDAKLWPTDGGKVPSVDRPAIAPSATQPAVVSFVAVPTTLSAAALIAAAPATQPVATIVAIAPATQPAMMTKLSAATEKIGGVPATQPVAEKAVAVAELAMVEPYAINLPASVVVHLYGSDDTNACWMELKLDATQRDALRTAAGKIAKSARVEMDEYDHLALPAAKPDVMLAWWNPAALVDQDLLCIADDHQRLWIAISMRTGRVFMFSDRSISFSS